MLLDHQNWDLQSQVNKVNHVYDVIWNLPSFWVRVLFAGGGLQVAGAARSGGPVASNVEEVRFFPVLGCQICSVENIFTCLDYSWSISGLCVDHPHHVVVSHRCQ